MQNPALIFDLSEVLIRGLKGVETQLAAFSDLPPGEVLRALGGQPLEAICTGQISEAEYLKKIIPLAGLSLPAEEIKSLIRENFRFQVENMPLLLEELAKTRRLYLLSDHAREWVADILPMHPFLQVFSGHFFSYELGLTKKDPQTFRRVLDILQLDAGNCLFIDDSRANIHSAAQAGIEGFLFTNESLLRKELIKRDLLFV